ncbi:methyltransferase domain-containing protein [Lentzea sp. NPDC058436]|uniref:methyltransferase domain-containing protein n=1 Tax=Lentzea sp. NPDC058436 TaxID=3346499 RepID=UPI00365B52B4
MSTDLLVRHADLLTCQRCRSGLVATPGGAQCSSCGRAYPDQGGFLDLVPDFAMPTKIGLGPLLLQDPLQVARYEDQTRISYLQVAAANWANQCTQEHEKEYLREHAGADGGPTVDIACGPGRWTRVLVEKFGADRVIGLDLSLAMLHAIHEALPGISLVRASGMDLPFADGSLGGVNCSAALQIMPDAAKVISEFGRVLAPGGTFTLASLTHAPRPLQRYFQHQQETVFGTKSFRLDDVLQWVRSSGMEVLDVTTPASFLLLTARKV